jgi:epsilon-lactone hydrolase
MRARKAVFNNNNFGWLIASLLLLIGASVTLAEEQPDMSKAPVIPSVLIDADGTVHLGPRTIPPVTLMSPEAKKVYAEMAVKAWAATHSVKSAAPSPASPADMAQAMAQAMTQARTTAIAKYPVDAEDTVIGGVKVSVYTPKNMPAKNRDKVLMEFEIESEAIAVANLAQMKVLAVHYRGAPFPVGQQDIVAVYRELLKTYKPRNIGMFGTSGGCNFAHTVVQWLPELKLPFPGAVGLLTCSGGSSPGDSRVTLDALDVNLSSYTPFGSSRASRDLPPPPHQPGQPYVVSIDAPIPKGYPPAFLLTGTRDMCLSQTAVLQQKLREAGVETELDLYEGMWHAFHMNLDMPESRTALNHIARFFESHLGS